MFGKDESSTESSTISIETLDSNDCIPPYKYTSKNFNTVKEVNQELRENGVHDDTKTLKINSEHNIRKRKIIQPNNDKKQISPRKKKTGYQHPVNSTSPINYDDLKKKNYIKKQEGKM